MEHVRFGPYLVRLFLESNSSNSVAYLSLSQDGYVNVVETYMYCQNQQTKNTAKTNNQKPTNQQTTNTAKTKKQKNN